MDKEDGVDWNIQIDRIIIEGIPLTTYQQWQLKESLEAELGRLFTGKGTPGGIETVGGKIAGASIRLHGSGSAPVQLGKQIAASVYNGLSGEKQNTLNKQ